MAIHRKLSATVKEPLPAELAARERSWLDSIRDGKFHCTWHRVGNVLWSSAIRVNGHRIALSYAASVAAAKLLDARLPTKAEADAMFRAAKHVTPVHVTPVSASLEAIQLHSLTVDSIVPRGALIDNEGKLWLAGAPPGMAVNYGWVDDPNDDGDDYEGATLRANGLYMWQDIGQKHVASHVDYSQTLRVVRDCPQSWAPESKRDTEPSMSAVDPKPTAFGSGMPPAKASRDVMLWQEFLNAGGYGPLVVDGKHWTATQRATERWQRDQRSTVPPHALPDISFRQAKHYHPGRVFGAPRLIVIHTAEMIERPDGAEALQSYAATMSDGRVASWHYAVDNDSITQSVKDEDTAFAAPGANESGLHIELCGFARQSASEWADPYSTDQLELLARLCASRCQKWNIPIVKLGPSDLVAGSALDSKGRLTSVRAAGFIGHIDASKAFKRSTHGDPGAYFPWSQLLERVKRLS